MATMTHGNSEGEGTRWGRLGGGGGLGGGVRGRKSDGGWSKSVLTIKTAM
jgi:hypothetical protein